MAFDPNSLLIFSLLVVAIHIVILFLMQEAGRPIALMISAATCIFYLQQAFYAYQMRQIGMLVQALGASVFFSSFLFILVHQMVLEPKEPAKSQQ